MVSKHLFIQPKLGIVMGYYGNLWCQDTLLSYPKFCQSYGFEYFIFAPKKYELLREKWSQPFSDSELAYLQLVRNSFAEVGVAFGIAITPFDLTTLTPENIKSLQAKINQLNILNLDILGVFFDDLPAEQIGANSASLQVEIAEICLQASNAENFITVPTYYSFDGILNRIYGNPPQDYFINFSKINPNYAIFWCGEHVLSFNYSQQDITLANEMFGRKIVVWDNFPVTDPEYLRDYLRLLPVIRSKQALTNSAGWVFNTMQWGNMSKISLAVARQFFNSEYHDIKQMFFAEIVNLCGARLAKALMQEINFFTLVGAKNIDARNMHRINTIFSNLTAPREQPFTQEICAFLDQTEK